jgi:hypothetical protein
LQAGAQHQSLHLHSCLRGVIPEHQRAWDGGRGRERLL